MNKCLSFELCENGLYIERQNSIPIKYKEIKFDCSYRIDILIEKKIIFKIKAVETFNPVHEAQILTYMKRAIKIRFTKETMIIGEFHTL